MPKVPKDQEPLFSTAPLAAKHAEDPFAVVNRGVDPVEVAKPVEESAGSLGKTGLEGVRQEMEKDVERTAELPGMTYAIAKGRELEHPKGSGGRAPAPGKPSKRPRGEGIPSNRLGSSEKMNRDRNSVPPHERPPR